MIVMSELPLLRLLQLSSPALPVGAFAYSQGLEHATEVRWVRDEATAADWILGLLEESLATLDVPLLFRLHAAFAAASPGAARRWSDLLFASRGSAELQAEEQRLGNALARLLVTLDIPDAQPWVADPRACYAAMFALAAARWEIPAATAAAGYLFAWTEAQTGAACRLGVIGQSGGQRILLAAGAAIPGIVARAATVGDDEIGFSAPAQAIASALHETQYSRIFRS